MLVFQLVYSNGYLGKIGVRFPLSFNLNEYFKTNAETEYNLYAVCYRIGTASTSGHYNASCKTRNQWYLIDDNNIYVINSSQVEQLRLRGKNFNPYFFVLFKRQFERI